MDQYDIAVLVDSSDPSKARLALAAGLGRRADAHLTGVGVVLPPFGTGSPSLAESPGLEPGLTVYPPVVPNFEGIPLAELEERDFADMTEGLSTSWVTIGYGAPAELVRLGRLVDLVILGQTPFGETTGPWGFHPEDVVLGIGGPCLIVPYAGSFDIVGSHVVIAWDGSREAARALRDARPLLRDSVEITVIGVSAHERAAADMETSVDQVVEHLVFHGLNARAESDLRAGLKVSDVLLDRVADLGADLLVTGSFHHTRLRERLVGGVTRELLDHMTVPVLMSH